MGFETKKTTKMKIKNNLYLDNNFVRSYDTTVAKIVGNELLTFKWRVEGVGSSSQTTTRHINYIAQENNLTIVPYTHQAKYNEYAITKHDIEVKTGDVEFIYTRYKVTEIKPTGLTELLKSYKNRTSAVRYISALKKKIALDYAEDVSLDTIAA